MDSSGEAQQSVRRAKADKVKTEKGDRVGVKKSPPPFCPLLQLLALRLDNPIDSRQPGSLKR